MFAVITDRTFAPYTSFILTPENRKQVASLLEQITENDLKHLNCLINLSTSNDSLEKNSRSISFRPKSNGKALTVKESDSYFKRLNIAFEKAQEQGLSSGTPIRDIKNKLDHMQQTLNQNEK